MATLTLDKSRNALAVLAWRKGLTTKRFFVSPLKSLSASSRAVRVNVRGQHSLTAKQFREVIHRKKR